MKILSKNKNRITSGLLAVLMVLSLLLSLPIYSSAATAEEHTESSVTVAQNEYLKIIVGGEGSHVLYTTGGNPDIDSDNNKKLLYDATSRTYVKINGSLYTFQPTNYYATPSGDSLYSYREYDGVKIERFISFTYNTYTGRYDTVEYKYVFTNLSQTTQSVGTRIMFDTMLGSNDSAPFRVNGETFSTGREYVGANIPQNWYVFDNINTPSVVANGTFYNDVADRPDKVQFINWGTASNAVWDCNCSGTIGDSAVNVYYNPIDLAPGQSRTVKTYYGISQFTPGVVDPQGEISVSTIAPSELVISPDGLSYQGNPFSFSSWVSNTGNATLNNVVAMLSLPDGLSASDTTVNIGDLSAGSSYALYWDITAGAQNFDTTFQYSLTVTADGKDPMVYNYSIFVPAVAHGHNYTEYLRSEPDCENPGYVRYICDCGDETVTIIPPFGHMPETTVIQEPTCTTPGIMANTCMNCGYTEYIYTYIEHDISESERVGATCTTDGYILYACSRCEYSYTEVIPGGHDYEAHIIRVATPTEEGEIQYICSICGDSYTVIVPMRQNANVLLVQDRLPWTENINSAILDRLVSDGYISGWDMTTTANLSYVNLAEYNIIYIANDQTTATYNQLAVFNEAITSFANAGGVVIYGACDHGWAGGNISYELPGGVSKGNYYSYHNYIVNNNHNVVTGILTDGKALTDALLYSTYSSHTYFTNLPQDATIILSDANGRPTLVEYAVGNGYVIASGLTWEYTYVRNFVNGTSFAKSVYDDLIVHAASLINPCNHEFGNPVVVDPTCTEQGYTMYTCQCGAIYKNEYVDALDHDPSDWITVEEPTAETEGYKAIYCNRCHEVLNVEVLPPYLGGYVKIECDVDSVILGQTIELYVNVYGMDPIRAMAIQPWFDSDIFEVVSVEWLVSGTLSSIEEGSLRSVIAWTSDTDVNCSVYKIVLLAKNLTEPATAVTAEVATQGNGGLVNVSVVPKVLTVVECPHASLSLESVNGEYHVHICNVCGYNVLSAHSFDNDCDTDCNDGCGYVRQPNHTSAGWENDSSAHWHICINCGEVYDYSDHIYDGPSDSDCNDCGFVRVMRGDFDGDNDVDSDDAIYLLNACFFEDIYPLNQAGDVDGNGFFDSDDAIYLLNYAFFPDIYPLY